MKTILTTAMMLFSLVGTANGAGTVELKKIAFNDIGMGGRMIRMSDEGIFLDDAGMCLEGTLTLKVNGFAGQRLICVLHTLDEEENTMADSHGEALSMYAFVPQGAQATCNVKVKVPYVWLSLDSKPSRIPFGVTVLNAKQEVVSEGIIDLDPRDVQVDGSKLPQKMMGDMFGGADGGELMGDIIGGLFGGNTARVEHVCGACDGTGLCPDCYGDAFFDPAACRRCVRDPGICRRCKGNKKETTKVDY